MFTVLFAIAAAFAQDPASASDNAGPVHVWTTEAVELKRFPDSTAVVATFEAGKQLEVVVDDGKILRVRSGTDFGWVPADKVSRTKPAAETAPTLTLPGQSPLQLSP